VQVSRTCNNLLDSSGWSCQPPASRGRGSRDPARLCSEVLGEQRARSRHLYRAALGARTEALSGSAVAGVVFSEQGVSYTINMLDQGDEFVFLTVFCLGEEAPAPGNHPLGTTGERLLSELPADRQRPVHHNRAGRRRLGVAGGSELRARRHRGEPGLHRTARRGGDPRG
jgi:hypothetical protein